MLKQLCVLMSLVLFMSSAFAALSDKINYGWVNKANTYNFDPTAIANGLGYFKNNCTGNTRPCSPDSGVQADGSLFCARGNSTQACFSASQKGNGLTNLKEHLKTKCGSNCLQAEKDFYTWYSKKLEYCKDTSKPNCSTYRTQFEGKIKDFYTPSAAVLEATQGEVTTGSSKFIQDFPAGDKKSCDRVKGKGSRANKSDSPFWTEVLGLATEVCGSSVDSVTGHCSASAYSKSVSSDLKNVFDRIRNKQPHDSATFNKEMGINLNQFKDIFCAKDTYTFVTKANQHAGVVLNPEQLTSVVTNSDGDQNTYSLKGRPKWLQSCFSSGMIKVVKKQEVSKSGGKEVIINTTSYKTDTDESCKFIPVSDIAQTLRSSRQGSLMLMAKSPRPGTAVCMMVKDVKLVSDEMNSARQSQGLPPAPSSMKLYVPEPGAPAATYQFESAGSLNSTFDAFKWHCPTSGDLQIRQTGGDGPEGNDVEN